MARTPLFFHMRDIKKYWTQIPCTYLILLATADALVLQLHCITCCCMFFFCIVALKQLSRSKNVGCILLKVSMHPVYVFTYLTSYLTLRAATVCTQLYCLSLVVSIICSCQCLDHVCTGCVMMLAQNERFYQPYFLSVCDQQGALLFHISTFERLQL